MLNYGELTNDFSLEHLHEALGDLLPVGNSTDIVKDGRAFAKGDSLFHLLDELNTSEVHEVLSVFHEGRLTMDGVWGISLVILNELTSTKEESQVFFFFFVSSLSEINYYYMLTNHILNLLVILLEQGPANSEPPRMEKLPSRLPISYGVASLTHLLSYSGPFADPDP